MAIRIVDVKITTNYSWEDISNLADWNAVKNITTNWWQLLQTTNPGELIFIEVELRENDWLSIKNNHTTWQQIKEKFANWLDVKNY